MNDAQKHCIQLFRRARASTNGSLQVGKMLSNARAKIGATRVVRAFNLPLTKTCCAKGSGIASPACRAVCYCWNQYKDRTSLLIQQERNLRISQRPDFPQLMAGAILSHRTLTTFKFHVFGDIYSVPYARKIAKIVELCPHILFFAYTRSWRVKAFLPALKELASHDNMNLLLSYDDTTGSPPKIKGTALAWMARTDANVPPRKSLIVFRATDERTMDRPPKRDYLPLTRIGGTTVCPHENGNSKNVKCVTCRLCFFKDR